MAGDWIKWTKGLTRKPEVVGIARRLSLSRRETAALLMEVWEWADDNTETGHVVSVTNVTLDDLFNVTGLGAAMKSEGWLVETEAGIEFPKFIRHNGKSAKKRLLAVERQQKSRKIRHDNVTENCDKGVTPSSLLFSSLLSSSDPKEEKETIEEITPDRFLPLTRAIQADPRYMNAGQRPLEKYPAIWISPSELESVFAKFSEVGLKGGRAVFEKVQGKLQGATNGTPKPNAYLWLIGWALKETLQEKKAALDAERSEVYLAKARAN